MQSATLLSSTRCSLRLGRKHSEYGALVSGQLRQTLASELQLGLSTFRLRRDGRRAVALHCRTPPIATSRGKYRAPGGDGYVPRRVAPLGVRSIKDAQLRNGPVGRSAGRPV